MTLRLTTITFDCADAARVAGFWSTALGRPVSDGASGEMAIIEGGEGWPTMFFLAVPEAKTAKNRMHLDLASADRTADVSRLLGLGARKVADHADGGYEWTVLTDVEGNEFCVVQTRES